jgi:hypothetical protein
MLQLLLHTCYTKFVWLSTKLNSYSKLLLDTLIKVRHLCSEKLQSHPAGKKAQRAMGLFKREKVVSCGGDGGSWTMIDACHEYTPVTGWVEMTQKLTFKLYEHICKSNNINYLCLDDSKTG